MARSSKKIVRDLFAMLMQRYPKQPPLFPKERQLLDHLVYAIFLENSSFQVASEQFALMENIFVDWNELRVTTARELAEIFHKLYHPIRTGERLRRTLQWIFDTVYKFDLEDYRAKGVNETAMFLNSNPFTTPFVTAYTIATIYKMQEIPLAEGAMQVFRLLDLVDIDGENREVVHVLANALNQSEKIDFFRVVHQLGTEMLDASKRKTCLDLLRELDAKIDERTHLPLVENPALVDPALIAREVSQAERKSKRSLIIEELELADESIDDSILVSDISELSVYIDEENGLTERYELEEKIDLSPVAPPVKSVAPPKAAPVKKEPVPVKKVSKPKETPPTKPKVVTKVANAKVVKPLVTSTTKAKPPAVKTTKKSIPSGSIAKSGTKKAVSKPTVAPVKKTASKATPTKVAPKVTPKKKVTVPVKSPVKLPLTKPQAKSPVQSAPKSKASLAKSSSSKSKTTTKVSPKKR